MTDDGHIFICDPPPGGKYVLTVPKKLTLQQVERLKVELEQAMRLPTNRIIVLDEGMKLEWLPGCPSWPDAEFCAA